MNFVGRWIGLLIVPVLVLSLSCGGSKNSPTSSSPNPPAAETTPVGAPNGDAATARIGPSGGSLSTPDGRLTLVVPAGAVAADTTFSILQITNNAFGGLGGAFRLGPAGARFSLPVTLTYQMADSDRQACTVQGTGLAWQDSLGYWNWDPNLSYQDSARTASVTVQHFSDYAPARWTMLSPRSATVRVGKYVSLHLTSCYPVKSGNGNGGRGCNCSGYGSDSKAVEWAVNGIVGGNDQVGTFASTGDDDATYDAPAHAPSPNTVAVSARLANGSTPQTQNVQVFSQITIEDPSTRQGEIYITYSVGKLVFNVTMKNATLIQIDDGPDETNYTMEGTAVIAPSQFHTDDGGTYVLTDPAPQAYNQEYGFKVLKTTPPTVRWSFEATWNYTLAGPYPAPFLAVISFGTRGGTNCTAFSDVQVVSLDDIDGSFDMTCVAPGIDSFAEWHFAAPQ